MVFSEGVDHNSQRVLVRSELATPSLTYHLINLLK